MSPSASLCRGESLTPPTLHHFWSRGLVMIRDSEDVLRHPGWLVPWLRPVSHDFRCCGGYFLGELNTARWKDGVQWRGRSDLCGV